MLTRRWCECRCGCARVIEAQHRSHPGSRLNDVEQIEASQADALRQSWAQRLRRGVVREGHACRRWRS